MASQGLFAIWLNVDLEHGIDTSVEVFVELLADPATVQAIAQYQAAPRT
jgi:enoyl-CoA hydratase